MLHVIPIQTWVHTNNVLGNVNSNLLYIISFQSQRSAASPSLSTDSDSVPGSSLRHSMPHPEHKVRREDLGVTAGSSRQSQGRSIAAHGDPGVRSLRGERGKTQKDSWIQICCN